MAAKVSLNHIGIAVDQLRTVQKLFEILGLTQSHSEAVPSQGVRTHFMPLPAASTAIELLEVTDPQGTVAKFIQKRGPGIHHLSFLVTPGELDPLCASLANEGYRLIYPNPQAGAHGMRINFIHPTTAGGLLIEIMEPAS